MKIKRRDLGPWFGWVTDEPAPHLEKMGYKLLWVMGAGWPASNEYPSWKEFFYGIKVR